MPSSLAVSTPQHAARCLGVKTDILKPSKYKNEYLDLKFNRADKISSFNADMNMSDNVSPHQLLTHFGICSYLLYTLKYRSVIVNISIIIVFPEEKLSAAFKMSKFCISCKF